MTTSEPTCESTIVCRLTHKVFSTFESVVFRKAETDGMPVLVVALGEQNAALPIRSLQREFGIADDSPDGRMLALVVRALDHVHGVRPGDPLPREVLDGQASWRPDDCHRAEAQLRLRAALVSWCGVALGEAMRDLHAVESLDADPRLRLLVQRAFDEAALALGLSDSAEVVRRVEQLADELACIEALRERLLLRALRMSGKLDRVASACREGGTHLDAITQVRRLARLGLKAIYGRFEEVDTQTAEVVSALRDPDGQTSFIRFNRDWLYRGQRAWEPLLTEWERVGASLDEAAWQLVGRTYHFLAPRYMPVQEWQTLHAGRVLPRAKLLAHALTW